jgi:hypothetical protein
VTRKVTVLTLSASLFALSTMRSALRLFGVMLLALTSPVAAQHRQAPRAQEIQKSPFHPLLTKGEGGGFDEQLPR